MESQTIQYTGHGDAQVDAYLSRPTTQGRHPGVIVIMEAFGLVDHIKDVSQRFAREGYVAIAPDLYTREGSPDPNVRDDVISKMFSIPDSQALGDLEGAAAYLKSQNDSNGRVGAIGFCSGGRYTLAFACNTGNLNAAIDSAGGYIIQEEHTPQRPVSPIDMVPELSCPLLALFGEEDPNPVAGPRPAPEGGAGLQSQGLRDAYVPRRGPCVLRRLQSHLPPRGGPGYVAQGAAFLRQAPEVVTGSRAPAPCEGARQTSGDVIAAGARFA